MHYRNGVHPRSQLKSRGLKDTLTRRAVLRTLEKAKRPLTPGDIRRLLHKQDHPIGIVTVYRVLRALTEAGLAHEHFNGEEFSCCRIPEVSGHHILLRCISCGTVRESHDRELCKRENAIARRAGFQSAIHTGELLGTCSQCT